LQALEEPLLFDERFKKLALGLEVVVDGGVGDTCLAGDVPDGSAREATLREEAEGGVQYLLASVRSPSGTAIVGCGWLYRFASPV
jgi:hypothetical protein